MSEPSGLEDPRTARDLLIADHDLPPLLARALDRVPRGWVLLWSQNELSRLGSPEANRRLAREARDHRGYRYRATEAERLRDRVRDLGFGFDFERGLRTIPTGGRPRFLLRELLEALDAELRRVRVERSRADKLELYAALLRPYFSAESTSTDPKGKLARTYDNV